MSAFDRCVELVDIPSVSFDEEAITDHVEQVLRKGAPWLEVTRVGQNLVARTDMGRAERLLLAGHTDTVPVNENAGATVDGDLIHGLGSADMKGGLAVMVELALAIAEPALDVTFVFYECEEVALEHNGLRKLFESHPDLLACDAAILGEPTGAVVEAGCQGTLRAEVVLAGERAHTARPWMGRNAVHRLGAVLERVAAFEERRPVIGGCEYREALQAVKVDGFVAGNVVPDRAALWLNHRFAPDTTGDEALTRIRTLLGTTFDESLGDELSLLDVAEPAPPSLDHPVLQRLVAAVPEPPRAKLGWTDVSFFAAHGIPATNFGPGDPLVAHTRDERVHRGEIDRVFTTMDRLLRS